MEQANSGESLESTVDPDPPTRGFWTAPKCCGLILLAMFAAVALCFVLSMWALNNSLPSEPAKFDRIAYTDADSDGLDAKVTRLENGEEVAFTPHELSVWIQRQLDLGTPEGEETPSKFRCDANEDGSLRLQLSLQLDEGSFSGRYLRLDVTGTALVEDGDPKELELKKLQFGTFSQDELTPDESLQVWNYLDGVIQGDPNLQEAFRALARLEAKDGQFTLKIRPGGAPGPRESAEPAELSPEDASTESSEEPK